MAITLHRSPRQTVVTADLITGQHQTAEHVAPGSYSNTHNEPKDALPEACVPFGSMQEKVLCPNLTVSAITPGPGAYLGPETRNGRRRKANGEEILGVGAASMRSEVNRMGPITQGSTPFKEASSSRAPGPGDYETEPNKLGKALPKALVKPVRPILDPLERTSPSMPSQRRKRSDPGDESAGADQISSTLVRHNGDGLDTVGPGEYDPNSSLTQRAVQGTTFHGVPSPNRKLFEPSVAIHNVQPPRDIPGPGSYEVRNNVGDIVSRADGLGDPVATSSFASQSAREFQAFPKNTVPGPGDYDVSPGLNRRGTTGVEGARISATERVGLFRSCHEPHMDPSSWKHAAGPGSYNIRSKFGSDPKAEEAAKMIPGTSRRQLHGVHHPALVTVLNEAQGGLQRFGSTDDRPWNKEIFEKTPSPGQYNKETARSHSMDSTLRERAKVGRKGAFGTCADRFYGSPLEGRQGLPDPGSFEERTGSCSNPTGANSEPRANFQSATPRFRRVTGPREVSAMAVGHTETPAPGDYMAEKAPNYRSPFRLPRKDHLSFGSSQKRFLGKEEPGPIVSVRNVPGPGYYSARDQRRVPGAANMRMKRDLHLTSNTSDDVGPGSYHSDLTTHMLKKTYNVTQDGATADGSVTPPSRTPTQTPGFSAY